MEKEIRCFAPTECEVRATRRGRTIDGFPIVFDKLSNDLGGFREIIKPEAVDGVLETSDILALMNHDESRGVLARYTNGNGSMEAKKADRGIFMSFEAPETPLGDEALSGVRRNDIRSMSFAFTVAEGGDKWEKQSDDTYLRTITKFDKLYDFSLVYRPAYSDTSVAVRSLVDLKTKEAEQIAAEAQKKVADLEEELRSKETPSASTEVAEPEQKPEIKEEVKPSYAELEEYYKNLESKL